MQENDRMVQTDLNGLELLQAIVDGKAPMPPMAQTIPMAIMSVAPGPARSARQRTDRHREGYPHFRSSGSL